MIGSARQTAGRPQKRNHQVMRYPAPVAGINNNMTLGSNDLNHCIYTYNLIPDVDGMLVREGYREWQIGIDDGLGAGVHTIIPFNTSNESTTDRLFAVNNEGIWDVTVLGATPIKKATFSITIDTAGYGTYVRYVNQAENDVMFYADNENGLWEYTASTNTWAVPTGITGVNMADINFVTSFKNNVWFAIRGGTVGYWLPLLANAGAVTKQYFGDKFKQGGAIKGMFNWTVDGGNGVDDIFVVVSSSGDVVVYTGSGPDQTDWGMKGIYYIGDIPNTPRFGSEHGGELYLLSVYGLISMNDMLRGVDTTVLMSDTNAVSMTAKIAGSIRKKMRTGLLAQGWDVSAIPSQGGILIAAPQQGSNAYEQFFYSLSTRGWGIWRGVPMECLANFENHAYIGTADGRVMIMDSPVDNALLTPTNPPENGDDIEFSILTSFNSMGVDGVYKRVHLIRPDFVSTIGPNHSSQVRYDFNIAEGINIALEPPVNVTEALWDTSVWDTAIWGADTPVTFPTIGGSWGYGRYCAITTSGKSRTATNLIGWDVVYTAGGVMF